ncbi:Tetratricopeptide repeat protein [Planctomycetes bacterium Pla163]|uniref:Tetratricopeptide repeat protein n=1 Tax=Rohdeia mirabilis TaxID=2528008 RepID=A0A518D0B5_9BACT|nr:Tetratricopeptide repeat protein [Planctomycetes bacterium Pla163]
MLWISRERSEHDVGCGAGGRRGTGSRAALGSVLGGLLLSSAAVGATAVASTVPSGSPTSTERGLEARQDDFDDLEALLAEERAAADDLRRRGRWSEAETALRVLIDDAREEGEDDWRSRAVLARLDLDRGEQEAALAGALAVLEGAPDDLARKAGGPDPELTRAATVRLEALFELGRTDELATELARITELGFEPGRSAQVDRAAGALMIEAGERAAGEARLASAVRAASSAGTGWLDLVAGGRAARASGELSTAADLFVRASRDAGREPQILTELADLYLEADGEVASEAAAARNPGPLLREARQRNPNSERTLLSLIELYRLNWRRSLLESDDLVRELLDVRPRSIDGLLAAAQGELLLGNLAEAREHVARAAELAPERRAVRAFQASLAAVGGDPAAARPLLDELAAQDPSDSGPERQVGTHLVDLYRFTEGRSLLEAAVERDPDDYRAWTALGRARANTGDVEGGRAALERAESTAALRQDAVRSNLSRVLAIVDEQFVEYTDGELTFAWRERGADVLELYLVPFYAAARVELSERYGYSTGPVRIEVFDRHADFSVRSTGFEGFPALGVCFGPVVTAVSPLSSLKGQFSWARTGYHEFTHVVHLGLSHNKCPRWVTEGLATWEEVRKNPSWTRNMRQDLVDARANGTIFPVRELNAAFRGPRVIFGYYQGGLLCDMLIARYGFGSMLELLARFDEGADLDTALVGVFERTPEQLDVEFAEYVDEHLAEVRLEPTWDIARLASRWLTLPRTAPTEAREREVWEQRWLDLGFAAWQADRRADAEEALRVIGALADQGSVPPRALFLRSQLALGDGDMKRGTALLERFVEAGGEDFRARLALAELSRAAGKLEDTERHLLAAEAAFPGHPDAALAAELALGRLLEELGRLDDAMAARARWTRYNADDLPVRMDLARWHASKDRHAEAARLYEEANDIDPFLRILHLEWGRSLERTGRYAEALREVEAWERVLRFERSNPPAAGAPAGVELEKFEEAEVEVLRARALFGLGREVEAREATARAVELAPDALRVRRLVEEFGA